MKGRVALLRSSRAQEHAEKVARVVGVGDHVEVFVEACFGQFGADKGEGGEILDRGMVLARKRSRGRPRKDEVAA